MPRTRKINVTKGEREQLREFWKQKTPYKQVSEKTGLAFGTINSWFNAFNAGFNTSTEYLNAEARKLYYKNPYERYFRTRTCQQKFENSFAYLSLESLHLIMEEQKERDSRKTKSYELNAQELIPRLLDELEKVPRGKILVKIIKEHYFDFKTCKKIGEEKKVTKANISQLRIRAEEKLKEILQRTEFSNMFC